MPTFRQKALGYFRNQDIRVTQAITPEGAIQPVFVEGIVRGYHRLYTVRFENGVWTCTCDLSSQPECAHRAAIQLVTGHRSPAATATKAEVR